MLEATGVLEDVDHAAQAHHTTQEGRAEDATNDLESDEEERAHDRNLAAKSMTESNRQVKVTARVSRLIDTLGRAAPHRPVPHTVLTLQ